MSEQTISRPGSWRLPRRHQREITSETARNVEQFLAVRWKTTDSVGNWLRVCDELQGARLFCIWVIPDDIQEEIRGLLDSALEQAAARVALLI